MNKDRIKKVQDVSVEFLKAIQNDNPGVRVMVCFSLVDGQECGTGLVVGPDFNYMDMKTSLFQLNGRAYDMYQ